MLPSQIFQTGMQSRAVLGIAGLGAMAISAAGTNQATATQLPPGTTLGQISNSLPSNASGVVLPSTEMGAEVWLRNDSAHSVMIYPFESAMLINNTASYLLASGKTAVLKALSANYWVLLSA